MRKPAFNLFLRELALILQGRNERYGTANIEGQAGLLSRLRDKLGRLESDAKRGFQASAQDWMDVSGYGGIGWLIDKGLWDDRASKQRVYFAHPIGKEESMVDVHSILSALEDTGLAVYWPRGAFMGGMRGHAPWIWTVNLEAIRGCDWVVAYLPGHSNGVAAELLIAHLEGKTVWVATDTMEPGSLITFTADRIFSTVEDMCRAIREVKHATVHETPAGS